jgi:UDP-glucose 4-epimerase
MKLAAYSSTGVFVTGSAGFIGSGVCRVLKAQGELNEIRADVRDFEQLREACGPLKPRAVIHLASKGYVTSPLNDVSTMLGTAVDGIVNVTRALNPQTLVLTSSCAVYGDTGGALALPDWKNVNPLSVYGLTKALAEEVAALWAHETGNTAMILRLGNVVGEGCGGLISYLVRHALRHQDAAVPARMRGAGKIVRDYVPLSHVSKVVVAAGHTSLPPGKARTLNVGSGEGMTNRSVAEIVQSVLSARGYRLEIEWDSEPAHGEGLKALLDVTETDRVFGLPRPSAAEVRSAIEEGTAHCIERYATVRESVVI